MDFDLAVRLCPQLWAEGYEAAEVAQLLRSGRLSRVRRGAYAEYLADDPVEGHRQLICATVPVLSTQACLSHVSAAVLHGLPVWPDLLARVHVSGRGPVADAGSLVHVHPAWLAGSCRHHAARPDAGHRPRSYGRHCARTVSYPRAAAIGDAALEMGLVTADLLECLDISARCRGVAQARRAPGSIEAGAESVGESFSRVVLRRAAIPPPALQCPCGTALGRSCPGSTSVGSASGR